MMPHRTAARSYGEHVAEYGQGRGRDQQRVGPHRRVIVARHQDQAAQRCGIGKCKRQGGKRPPGVAHHNRTLDVETCKGAVEQGACAAAVHAVPRGRSL